MVETLFHSRAAKYLGPTVFEARNVINAVISHYEAKSNAKEVYGLMDLAGVADSSSERDEFYKARREEIYSERCQKLIEHTLDTSLGSTSFLAGLVEKVED